MHRTRSGLRVLAVIAGALAVVCASALYADARAQAARPYSEYVALGDSFAAGPLIAPQEAGDPCFRSKRNYAHLLARALRVTTFRDVTCSSATTDNILTTPQKPSLPWNKRKAAVPIQLAALTRRTTLVTVTIGANDIGLAGLARTCINILPLPLGKSCRATQTAGGVDRGAARIDSVAPKIAATLDAIHRAAPRARVLITSYADYVQHDGCVRLQPMYPADANYLQGLVVRLGELTRRVAAAHRAEYVDFIGPGQGHDGCQTGRNWANILHIHGMGGMPLHPTTLGEANFARILLLRLFGLPAAGWGYRR